MNRKARALLAVKNAEENKEGYDDPSSERQIESRAQVRQAANMKKPNGRVGRSSEAHGRRRRTSSIFCGARGERHTNVLFLLS